MSIRLKNSDFLFLYIALSLAYLTGLFVPLMENDAAQHASMAMRMTLTGDYLHIFKGGEPYLDKPHLHFWLAAFSMKLFGINDIAYRLPSLLFLMMAAGCTFHLARLLYRNMALAHVAALMFGSAQTIILSAHDVRTDAILTGAVALGVYHVVAFILKGKTYHILLGALGTAMALGAKGMVGVGIIGLCVFFYLCYSWSWSRFFRLKVLWGLLVFLVGILPILYAYYVQFDLHPEQLVRGEYNVSGIRFILWDQSFKRFSGEDFGTNSPDPLFFFHTLLWVFIPFSVLLYGAVFNRTAFFIKTKFARTRGYEFLTIGGFWSIMLVFSFSKFKLPHYLNSLIPIVSVLTAAYVVELATSQRGTLTKVYLWFQYLLFGIGLALAVYLGGFAFGIGSFGGLALSLAIGYLMLKTLLSNTPRMQRIVVASVLFAATLNVFLNTQFYPPLTQYQAGLRMAGQLKQHRVDPAAIVMPDWYTSWTLDFYSKHNIPRIPMDRIAAAQGKYAFIAEADIEQLDAMQVKYRRIAQSHHYRITRLKSAFLNPKTRAAQLSRYVLVQII